MDFGINGEIGGRIGEGGQEKRRPGRPRKNQSPQTTTTENGKTGGTTAGQTGQGEPRQIIPGMASGIDVPTPSPPKKGRKTKDQKNQEEIDQLSANIAALTQIIGLGVITVTKDSIWAISEQEAASIAEPAARILARHDMTKNANEYADYILLVSAVSGVVLTRVIQKKLQKSERGAAGERRTEPIRQVDEDSRTNAGPNPPNAKTSVKGELASIAW